ncbi:cyclin-T1-5-like isoform X2 [Zingiber officinale]|uniref:cyclin-T1-5-like isoform X2 n=1 Tax=Zingiber officinale TaxID=94328 RepID=UPI001C4D8624|nr:cyclin-T1-5-like isoform X2 [Zingiber officinale]XP_042431286.1 cyclin-T1-5-like isoform X2 [Zingiber officinale]XP_042431287.1 cyclin-T1-5-like isoform X2 [Zingiber officinale]
MAASQPFDGGYRLRSASNSAAAGPSYSRFAFSYAIFHPAAPQNPFTNLSFSTNQRDHALSDFYAASGGPPPTKKRRFLPDRPAWDSGANGGTVSSSCRSVMRPPRREDENARRRDLNEAQPHEQREPVRSEAEGAPFVTRSEIEMCSPSRKDGIDCLLETELRFSYCSYLQHLGLRLDLPQTTIGAAMVLCHRFFFRRSHACNDRFLIATAALFLATKSEDTPCLLNSVLRVSCEVSELLGIPYYPYLHHNKEWFEQYRERVIETEQKILTTLDFELQVEHPFVPLASVLGKLGLSQSVLHSLAWSMVSKGLNKSSFLGSGCCFIKLVF